MYVWKIPERSSSERGDPHCIAWAYHSTVDVIKVYYEYQSKGFCSCLQHRYTYSKREISLKPFLLSLSSHSLLYCTFEFKYLWNNGRKSGQNLRVTDLHVLAPSFFCYAQNHSDFILKPNTLELAQYLISCVWEN